MFVIPKNPVMKSDRCQKSHIKYLSNSIQSDRESQMEGPKTGKNEAGAEAFVNTVEDG
jgi:hypothetical protein